MRLDHLLSKEYEILWSVKRSYFEALFNFEGAGEKWGRSSAGRASALHAEGQEFDPPRLHQDNGRIAQVVRAHA